MGLVSAVATHEWGVTAILAVTFLLAASMWALSWRAKRRVPETQKWIDDLSR
jgi:hypothetical protein